VLSLKGVVMVFRSKWLISIIVAVVFVWGTIATPAFAQSDIMQHKLKTLVEKADRYSRQPGKGELALSYMNKAIQLQPGNKDLYYRRAFVMGRIGAYSAAIQEFSRFVNMQGYDHAVRFRGDCFMALNDFRSASRDYLAFLRKAPGDSKVWLYLAESFALMGDKKSALEAVDRGLATGGHWSKALQNMRIKIMTDQRIIPHKPLSN
jgi:predicted Zn-dependent protease